MESKVTAASFAAMVAGAVVQAIQDQGITIEGLVAAVAAAAVGLLVGWLRRNGNLAPSTLEAAESARQ